jgi:hypothetical protein
MQGMGQDQPSHRSIANLRIYKFNILLGQHNNMALDKPER